jgi:hypothetical protein
LLSTVKCGKKNAKSIPPQKLGYAGLSKAMTGVEAQLLHDDAVVDGVSTGGADGWSKDATELGRPVVGKAHFPLKLPRPRIDPVDPEAIGEPELQDVVSVLLQWKNTSLAELADLNCRPALLSANPFPRQTSPRTLRQAFTRFDALPSCRYARSHLVLLVLLGHHRTTSETSASIDASPFRHGSAAS